MRSSKIVLVCDSLVGSDQICFLDCNTEVYGVEALKKSDYFLGSMDAELEEKIENFDGNVAEIQQLGFDEIPKKMVNSDSFSDICMNVQENYIDNGEGTDEIVKNVADSNDINEVCEIEFQEKNVTFEGSDDRNRVVFKIRQLGSIEIPKKMVNSDGLSDIYMNVHENYVDNGEGTDEIVKNAVESFDMTEVYGHEFQEKNVTLEGPDDLKRIVSEIQQLGSDETPEKMLDMYETGQVSEPELVKEEVGFESNEKISEFLELKDAVGMTGRENSSEIVHFGSCDSQSGANCEDASFVSKSDEPVMNKTIMNILRIDDTVVLEILEIKRESNGKGGIKDSSNEAVKSEKIRYARKELEKLRFVGGKERQKKVWQDVYNGFSEYAKKEYDELGSLKQRKHGGGVSDHHHQTVRKRNNHDKGILGVPAAIESCNHPNIFVLKRTSIINC